MIAYYPLLIPFLPLVVAMMTFLLEGLLGEKVYRIGVLMKMVVLGISLMVFREVIIPGNEAIHLAVFSSSWSGLLQFYFLIDRLAAVMIVLMYCFKRQPPDALYFLATSELVAGPPRLQLFSSANGKRVF